MKQEKRKIRRMSESVGSTSWLQRIGIAGFIFFLAKGLVWIVAFAWVAY